MALTQLRMKDHGPAEDHFERAVGLLSKVGARRYLMETLGRRAELAAETGRPAEAVSMMEQAMGIAETLGRHDRREVFSKLRDAYLREAENGPGREKPVDNKL